MLGLNQDVYYLSHELKKVYENKIILQKKRWFKRLFTKRIKFSYTYDFNDKYRFAKCIGSVFYKYDDGIEIDLPDVFTGLKKITIEYDSKMAINNDEGTGLCGQLRYNRENKIAILFMTELGLENFVHELTHLLNFYNYNSFFKCYSNLSDLEKFDKNKKLNSLFYALSRIFYLSSKDEQNCVQAQSTIQHFNKSKSLYVIDRLKESYKYYTIIFSQIDELKDKDKITFLSKFKHIIKLQNEYSSVYDGMFIKDTGIFGNLYFRLLAFITRKSFNNLNYKVLTLKECEEYKKHLSNYILKRLENIEKKKSKIYSLKKSDFYRR